ncbi:MAG: HepT-like ribonuclease domain-containing protein [Planctomycetota bacterium]
MRRNRNKFIFDMLDSCRFLWDLTKNEDVTKYKNDRVFRGAVERELQIIGEAMQQLKALSPRTPDLPDA